MNEPVQWIIERSFQIAWEYLLRSGQLGEPTEAGQFLFRAIEGMARKGERRKIALANRAIDAYRRRNHNVAAWWRLKGIMEAMADLIYLNAEQNASLRLPSFTANFRTFGKLLTIGASLNRRTASTRSSFSRTSGYINLAKFPLCAWWGEEKQQGKVCGAN
jgi:hypothetical protein